MTLKHRSIRSEHCFGAIRTLCKENVVRDQPASKKSPRCSGHSYQGPQRYVTENAMLKPLQQHHPSLRDPGYHRDVHTPVSRQLAPWIFPNTSLQTRTVCHGAVIHLSVLGNTMYTREILRRAIILGVAAAASGAANGNLHDQVVCSFARLLPAIAPADHPLHDTWNVQPGFCKVLTLIIFQLLLLCLARGEIWRTWAEAVLNCFDERADLLLPGGPGRIRRSHSHREARCNDEQCKEPARLELHGFERTPSLKSVGRGMQKLQKSTKKSSKIMKLTKRWLKEDKLPSAQAGPLRNSNCPNRWLSRPSNCRPTNYSLQLGVPTTVAGLEVSTCWKNLRRDKYEGWLLRIGPGYKELDLQNKYMAFPGLNMFVLQSPDRILFSVPFVWGFVL